MNGQKRWQKFTLVLVGIVAMEVAMLRVATVDVGILTAFGGTIVAILAFFFKANIAEHKINGK